MKKYLVILIAITMLSSCLTLKIKTPIPYQKGQSISKMALFPVMIGELQQPIFPLIDAAAFNKKTNGIADQIMDAQKISIDRIRANAANTLKKHFECEVIYGDTLQNMKNYLELSDKYNFKKALSIDDDNFPIIITSTGDINPYMFSNGDVINYFKLQTNYQQTITHLCAQLEVDAIAVSFSKLNVIGVTAFGISGNLRLDTYLYVFNKNGSMIANGFAFSKPLPIKGKDVGEYQLVIDNFPIIFEPLVTKLVNPTK